MAEGGRRLAGGRRVIAHLPPSLLHHLRSNNNALAARKVAVMHRGVDQTGGCIAKKYRVHRRRLAACNNVISAPQ